MTLNINSIGTIYTNYNQKQNMPIQPCGALNEIGKIVLKDNYKNGLKDIDGFSYIYLIYYFNQSKDEKLSVIPFNDKKQIERGVFSTRTPVHPNKLGLSLVKLLNVENNVLTFQGVDILDKTPLIDIKPYIPEFDYVEENIKTGWMKSKINEVQQMKSDSRF